ncbi:hypothetical protein BTH42_26570 [Burkholderia sp. SRS-W-2-2016]|uniref:carboxylesterase family protein n=1 Tax=Burkholderia sp. SRS-W-2-2016 TaxID=1926878 RepID=UPI00094B4449|nr:carboxylesterase family protein [Burkholderia sp. SRS-W-2-2016]OLL28571.1 hypothetical protein BTH42_26570 [Burkholderia sp. SRS-W-2-2016]
MQLSSQAAAPVVATQAGKVSGISTDGVDSWLGVPYGAAGGELGPFAEVGPVQPWNDTLDCARVPAVFVQPQSRLASIMGPAIDAYPQSEHAFTVNVFAPRGAHNLPVLVFVHGGGFSSGGGTRWYDGGTLARNGQVVVVTVNYRLGIWGNLCAAGAPANNAVRDVLAALRWIAANIGGFGGDPARVTLSGQSAGAALTRMLTLCDESRGLFQRAILMSCPGRISATRAEIGEATQQVMNRLGAADLAALAQAPSTAVLGAVLAVTREFAAHGSITPLFRPYADGALLHDWMDEPETSAAHAHCREVLVGFTRDENTSFHWQQADALERAPDQVFALYRRLHGDAAPARYLEAASRRARATPYTQWIDATSAEAFGLPALSLASEYGKAGRAFAYRFDMQTRQPHLYAPHCLDLPFFFDNLADWFDAPMLAHFDADELQPLATRFSTAIVNFARDGDPGIDGWPAFSDATPFVMPFDR